MWALLLLRLEAWSLKPVLVRRLRLKHSNARHLQIAILTPVR